MEYVRDVSGPDSAPLSPWSTARLQHLPPRFLELHRRVCASEGEPVYVGQFKLIRLLGVGGFGMVFLARDAKLGRLVAVKLCPVPSPEDGDLVAVEAKLLAAFSHPNIVTVYEVGAHDGDVFFAMEYIEGCDGGAYVKRWQHWQTAVSVYEKAAAGLATAHAYGIVHGDFKPENVLIGDDGRVCVADFGLAALIDGQPDETDARVSHRLGTLPYMAPELLDGKPATPATDQWALCVSLWETLYYKRPFAGQTVAALLESIEGGLPWHVGMIPRSVQAVLHRGLSFDPADRYPNMRALIAALRETRTAGATPGDHQAPKQRSWFALVLALACGAALGAFGWAQRSRTVEPAPMAERDEPADAAESSEPETSVSPCVLDDAAPAELDSRVIAVCMHIRKNEIEEAHKLWRDERKARIKQHRELVALKQGDAAALTAALTADTNIIAQTFADQGKRLKATDSETAALATKRAKFWMTGAEDVSEQVDDGQP